MYLCTQEQLIGDTEPTPAPKIFKETCRIDWNLPAERIHNLVRGLSPYPAAWTTLMDGGTEVGAVKVFETRIVKSHVGNIPGEIIIEGDTLTVGCGNGEAIEILSLQAPGKRRMPTPDFLRGSRLVNPKFI